MKKKGKDGFGIIEIIVAVGIFILISVTAVSTVVQSFSTNRLAEEEGLATVYAQEGIEAVRSIKSQSWLNLATGTYGIASESGHWIFSGTSNTLGKFTRQLTISEVFRDLSGNIVQAGGILDPDIFKIDSEVIWDFSPTRTNSVVLSAYLSNYEKEIVATPTPTPTITPSPTPSPTVTPSPTLTPSPTPGAATCSSYCQGQGYLGGVCRQNPGKCSQNGETHEGSGDAYCTGGPAADTCCCQ